MDAFVTRLEASVPAGDRLGVRPLWYGWNAGDADATVAAWPGFRANMAAITVLTRAWARALARQTDLVEGLVRFCESRL